MEYLAAPSILPIARLAFSFALLGALVSICLSRKNLWIRVPLFMIVVFALFGVNMYLSRLPGQSPAAFNAAVIHKLEAGSFFVCSDPESGRVKYAMLVERVDEAGTFHGRFFDKDTVTQTPEAGVSVAFFESCVITVPRKSTNRHSLEEIGRIVTAGLNR